MKKLFMVLTVMLIALFSVNLTKDAKAASDFNFVATDGATAIEGQAMGKIVLASNIGGSLENLVDGVSGRLFKSNDAKSLAEAMDWALSLPAEEKKKFSEAAIKNVHDNFTKQIMCDKTIAVYNELLKMN